MSKPILYFLVTNSLHQDQRLHRICGSLSSVAFDVTLVGVKRSEDKFESDDFKTFSLQTIFKSSFLFYLEINLRFFFFLLFKKLDGVVANDLDTLFVAKLISTIRKKKLFIDLHEYFTEVPELENQNFKKWIWSCIGRFGISNSTFNYTVNESLANILGEKYATNFEHIYNYPVKKEIQRIKKPEVTFDLVYVGVVNKGRGLKEAILAIKNLPETTLSIYGVGDILDLIKKLIEDNHLQSRVYLKGFIENKTIHEELQKYDLGLNLLKPSSLNYHYSSANKHFDYIMAGIPCLSMQLPEYELHNKKFETSILLESLDVNVIGDAITTLKDDHQLKEQLITNCTKASQAFNWETQKPKLLEIYNSAFNL